MKKNRSEIFKKYPEASFEHWLAMFCVDQSTVNEQTVKDQIEMYKTFEGEEAFSDLQVELKSIMENNDLDKFLDVMQKFGLNNIKNNDLVNMAQIILNDR